MVTALLFLIILDIDPLAAFLLLIVLSEVLLVLVLIIRLQSPFSLKVLLPLCASLGAESGARLTHLVKQVVTATRLALAAGLWVIVIVEDLFVLCALLVQLQVLYHLLVLLLAFHFLEVVFVELVFEVVDVGEFLDVDRVETFQL